MGVFSRKTKSKQDDGKADEGRQEERPRTAYKRLAKHAGADAADQCDRMDSSIDHAQVAMANQRRMESAPYDSTLTFAQEMAQEFAHLAPGMLSGPPSPRTEHLAMHRVHSDDDPDKTSPRDATAPWFKTRSKANGPKLFRSSTDYFANSNGKPSVSAGSNYQTSDSGYESAEPSRAPSEHNSSKGYLAQKYRLPELTLGSEGYLEADMTTNSKNVGNVSPLDLNADARSVKSNRSINKRTRFEGDVEPMPALGPSGQQRKDSGETSQISPALRPQRPETFVQLQIPQPQLPPAR
jgi:hypothetical protein